MKRHIPIYLLLVLLLVSTTTKAQPYKSIFGDSVSAWTSIYYGLAIGSMNIVTYTDTMIKGKQHKKLLWDFNAFPVSTTHQLGLLREDTTTGQVWYRSLPNPSNPHKYDNAARDTVDILIMDMTLQLGDTFYTGKVSGMGQDTMAIVDSVYIDAENRKHIRFNKQISWKIQLEFIESVGTTLGMAYKDSNILSTYGASNEGLICAFHDSANIYSTKLKTTKCIPDVGISQLNKHKQLPIYPNPNNGEFTISIPTLEATKIVITNINGQVVYRKEVSNKQQMKIDLSTQPEGIYTIQLVDEENSYINKLLLE